MNYIHRFVKYIITQSHHISYCGLIKCNYIMVEYIEVWCGVFHIEDDIVKRIFVYYILH